MLLESFHLALEEKEPPIDLKKKPTTKGKKQKQLELLQAQTQAQGQQQEPEQVGKDGSTNKSTSSLFTGNENDFIASLDNLRAMLAPFVLRRLKRDVLNQLVAKDDHVLKVQMTESQNHLYGDIIEKHVLRRTQVSKSKKNKKNDDDYSVVDLTGHIFL